MAEAFLKEQKADISGVTFNISLTIDDVNKIFRDPKDHIVSRVHVEGRNSGRKWYLAFHPKGPYNERWAAVYLHLHDTSRESEANVKFSIAIVDAAGKTLYTPEGESERSTTMRRGVREGWDFYINSKMLLGGKLAANDSVKLVCRVHVNGETRVPELRLQDDLEDMFNVEAFSDVRIECDGRTFHCSKFILAARSRVFRAMFDNEFAEVRTGVVIVDDIRPEIMEQVLRFVYTGKDYNYDEETAHEVLRAADKYGLERLKIMCEEAIIGSVTDDNALDMLMLSKMFLLNNLKESTLRFLRSRKPDFLAEIIDEITTMNLGDN